MEDRYLAHLPSLTMAQKVLFAKAKLQTVSDVLLKPPADLARKCRTTLKEMDTLIDLVCRELYREPQPLQSIAQLGEERFTTGDSHLDDALGGGIQTGMLWEFSGENNAGKTQLALQLSLAVQLPRSLGGISGAACYITTREGLQTERLRQMVDHHPRLSPEHCGLSEIQTVRALNFRAFTRVLSETIPAFADRRASDPGAKPVKLVVVDTLTDFFDASKNPEYESLATRAIDLRKVGVLLHRLAAKYQLAIVALGAARTAFAHKGPTDRSSAELFLSDQEVWFSRAHSLRGEDAHEAIMGHVWATQLNVRIMMTRTTRTRTRRQLDANVHAEPGEKERARKRRRLLDLDPSQPRPSPSRPAEDVDEAIAYRRLSVIFSAVAPPASCDYVIVKEGVVAFPAEEPPPSTYLYTSPTPTPASSGVPPAAGSSQVESLPQPSFVYASRPPTQQPVPAPLPPTDRSTAVLEEDEDAELWALTQDTGDLFDALQDNVIGGAAAEEGPSVEDKGLGSDSDHYWDD